jgi:signal transduction histidine kinase
MPALVEHAERELWLYRRLGAFVGAVYLVWWAGVELLLPHAYNPLLGRLAVVGAIWAVVAASYASASIARHIAVLWTCGLWLVTAHYFYLFYENAGDLNWIVGSFVTVTAVTMGMLSRASLLAYSAFATALSLGLVIALPELRHSVFVPGIMTVLLQANIGMASRLRVVRDLAASNEHFQLLFDSTFEGVLIHEAGATVQVNDALVRILGGADALAIMRTDERAAAAATSAPVELQLVRADGESIDVEIRGKPFRHGTHVQRLVTVEDVTERKQHAAELKRTNDALARSNLDLQRFAYVASHDLQTPLRGIASFVDLLRSSYGEGLDAQANDWLARIGRSVDHLQTLIRDLLEYSRVDAEPRAYESVAMREVLDRALSLLDVAGATITAGELPEVPGDRSQLVQLMLNLVGNALKYRGQAAPQVHITAVDRGDDWLFEVRDNGIGIAPKHHQQIFEIFKRLHDQKEFPGTGIGLAICRRVVDRHGGTIWVESKPGDGSAFFFTIAKRKGSHR